MNPHERAPLPPDTLRQSAKAWAGALGDMSWNVASACVEMVFHSARVQQLASAEFRCRLQVARNLARNEFEKREIRKALRPHLTILARARFRQHVAKAHWIAGCFLLGLFAGAAAPSLLFSRGSRQLRLDMFTFLWHGTSEYSRAWQWPSAASAKGTGCRL